MKLEVVELVEAEVAGTVVKLVEERRRWRRW